VRGKNLERGAGQSTVCGDALRAADASEATETRVAEDVSRREGSLEGRFLDCCPLSTAVISSVGSLSA